MPEPTNGEIPSPSESPQGPESQPETSPSTTLGSDGEVNQKVINELFAADPDTLTDDQLRIVVNEFRKARARWASEEAGARTEGRRTKTSKGVKQTGVKVGAKTEALPEIDLSNLNLDMGDVQ